MCDINSMDAHTLCEICTLHVFVHDLYISSKYLTRKHAAPTFIVVEMPTIPHFDEAVADTLKAKLGACRPAVCNTMR